MNKVLNHICAFQIFKFDELNITLNNNSIKDSDECGGDIVSVFGPSGSGKTSLFRGIALALLPYYNFKISDQQIKNNETLRYLNKFRTNGEEVKKELKQKEYLYQFLEEMFVYDRSYILINLGNNLNLIMYPRSKANYEYNKYFLEGDIQIIHKKLLEDINNGVDISLDLSLENLKKNGTIKIIELGEKLTKFFNIKEENAIIGIGNKANYENLILLLFENMGNNDKIIDKTLLTTLGQDLIKENQKKMKNEESDNVIEIEHYVQELFDNAIQLSQSSLVNSKETNEYYSNLINFKKEMFIELNKFYFHYEKYLTKNNETNYSEKIELFKNDLILKNNEHEKIIPFLKEEEEKLLKMEYKKKEIEKKLKEFLNHKDFLSQLLKKELSINDMESINFDNELTILEKNIQIDFNLEKSKKNNEEKIKKINETDLIFKELINKEKTLVVNIKSKESIIKELSDKLNLKIIYLFNDKENKLTIDTKTLLLSLNISQTHEFNNEEIALLNDVSSSLINISEVSKKLKSEKEKYISNKKFDIISIEDIQKELKEETENLEYLKKEYNKVLEKKSKIQKNLEELNNSNYNENKAKEFDNILSKINFFNYLKTIDFNIKLKETEESISNLKLNISSLTLKIKELENEIENINKNINILEQELNEINKIINVENQNIFDSLEKIDDVFDDNIVLNNDFDSYISNIKNNLLNSFNITNRNFDIKRLIKGDINIFPTDINDIVEYYLISNNLIQHIEDIKKSFLAEVDNFANEVRTKRPVFEKIETIEKQQIKKCVNLLKLLEKTTNQGGSIKLKFEKNEILSNYINKITDFLKELDELENEEILNFLDKKHDTLKFLNEKIELLKTITINSIEECIVEKKPLFITKIFLDIEGSKGNYTALESFVRNEIFQLLSKDLDNYVFLPMVIDESASIDKSFKKETLLGLNYKGPKILLAASEDNGNDYIDSIIRFIPCENKITTKQLKRIDGTL